MKIKLPFRETYSVIAFLFVCFLPNFLNAQNCTICPTPSMTLDGCPEDGTFANGIFDLTSLGSGMVEYYEACAVSNDTSDLTMPIGGDLTMYMAADGQVVYVQELSGSDCSQIFSVTLNVREVSVSITMDPSDGSFCDGSSSVTLTANPSNESGTPAYTWNTPTSGTPTGSMITASTEDDYSVVMTDDNCTVTSEDVSLVDQSITVVTSRTNITCPGENDGSFMATVSGGSGTYDYDLFKDAAIYDQREDKNDNETWNNLPPGDYYVIVTDVSGAMCAITSDPVRNISEPMALDLDLEGVAPSMAGGSDGMIDVTISNGTANYAWERTGSGGPKMGSSSNDEFTISGTQMTPGSYNVTITDDNGCEVSGAVTIPDVACDIEITNTSTTPPDCRNGDDGFIVLTTNSYTTDYEIMWSKDGGSTQTEPGNFSVNDVTIDNLSPGNYNFTVTDAVGCSDETSTAISVGNPPAVSFSASQLSEACDGVDNGSIQVNSISNGTGPYTVSWTENGTVMSNAASNDNNQQITGLGAGTYSVTVTDDNGCGPAAQSVTINELDEVNVTIVGDEVFCFGESNGSLETNPNSGFTYDWSTGASSPTITIPNPGGSSVNYQVTVTDGNSCTGSDVVTVSRLPDLTVTLNTSASKTSVTCDSDCDGRIDINAGGAGGDFDYSWTGPGGFSRTTEDIDDLCPGTYFVTVTDSDNGCSETFSQEISVPEPITVSVSASSAECNGESNGSASVTADGGTAPYDYLWTPGNQTTAAISGLSAGTYTVRVTDDNGCFKTESVTVNEPAPVVGIISPTNPEICEGESVSLTVDGGTSFSWSDGLGSGATVNVSPASTTTYNVIVTDAATNNCTDVASVTVQVNDLPEAEIDIVESSGLTNNDGLICDGEPVTITASGGSSYNWDGGLPNPFTVSPGSGMEVYAVTVTDGNGCTDTETVEIEINENPTPSIDFSSASQEVQDIQNIQNNSIANCGTISDCTWLVENVPVSGGDCDGISPTFSTQGAKEISLTVLNSCGCSAERTDILEIFAADGCAVEQFTVNNGLGVACVGDELSIVIAERPTPNCVIMTRSFDVFRDGVLLDPANNYEYTGDKISFLASGTYEMRYTLSDNCGCSRPSTRSIVVSPPPSIGFMAGNPTSGCEGETVNIQFSGFDAGEKVDVMYANGNVFTYEVDNFDLQLGENTTETLTIASVENSVCPSDVSGQTIEIDVTPKFEVVSQTTSCTDDGLSYTLTIRTAGGEASENILAEGIAGTSSGANNYIIPNLDPTKEYNFTLSRGDICDPIEVNIPMIICNCTFVVGDFIAPLPSYAGCEVDVFNIDNIFTPSEDFDPVDDTLIYFLHSQQAGVSLGKVYAIYPYETSIITSDFPGFSPNITFRLSPVGIRKATLEDFDFADLTSFDNGGSERCLSVVSGVPVRWFKTPTPELGTADNSNFICRNAYDFMLFAKNAEAGSDIDFSIEGIPDENIREYGFQDTVFVFFEDNGQDSFNVTITETKINPDGTTSFTCQGSTTETFYVREGSGAPEPSQIILWPGNILASTADSSTTCFEWGFENFGQLSGVIGTDKYLYAASDIDFTLTTRTYFVDTYFCDDPDCVTRIYYNDDGPSPGLNYKKEETFSYIVKPNPNRGQFTLDLFSDVEGDFTLRIIDITGKPVFDSKKQFGIGQNIEDFNIEFVPKGIYFIQIMNTALNEYSINKLVIK